MRKAGPTPESRVAGEPRDTKSRPWRLAALLVAVMMVIAACGDAEEPTDTSGAAEAPDSTATADVTDETASSDDTSDDTGPSGTLTVAISSEWETLDPQMHRQRNAQLVARLIHDNLVTIDPETLDFVPKLAREWELIDPMTWEVKLVEGVTFHNGEPLTSEAVKFTVERLADPELNSPRLSMGQPIQEVEIIDDYTFRFHMGEGYVPGEFGEVGFPYSQEILAPEHTSSLSPEEFALNPVGTGPFKFVEYVPGQRLVLEANRDYWDGVPQVETLVLRPIPEVATRAAELLAGSVDIIDDVDVDTAQSLDGRAQIITARGTALYHLEMNIVDGPFAPVEVRRALNMAIDRQSIVDSLYGGNAAVEYQVAFLGQDGYIPDWEPYPYDPDAAREVLSQITEPIEMLTNESDALQAEAVAQQLRDVGLDVSVVEMEAASLLEAIDSGNFYLSYRSDASALGTFGPGYYDLRFSCGARDTGIIRSGFCDPEIDALHQQVMEEPTAEARNEGLQEVNRRIMDNPPWVPLWTPESVYAAGNHVQGFQPWPTRQLILHTVSVDN